MQRFAALVVSGSLVFSALGCGTKSEFQKAGDLKKAPALDGHDHDHGAKGPHGGSLVALGKHKYHGELILDHDAHTLRVLILGEDAKTPTAIAATAVTVTPEGKPAWTLKAVPLESEKDGKSSRFELVDDGAVHTLMDAGFLHGSMSVKVGDETLEGHIDYHVEHAEHKHDEKDAPAKDPAAPKTDETQADPAKSDPAKDQAKPDADAAKPDAPAKPEEPATPDAADAPKTEAKPETDK